MPRRPLLWAAGLALLLASTACGSANVEPVPSAGEILERATEAARGLESVHFVLEVQGTTAPLPNGLQIARAEGDVRRPGNMRMQVSLSRGGVFLETELRVVDGRAYLLNPFALRFEELGEPTTVPLLDPELGLAAAVASIAQPELATTARKASVTAYRIRGTVPARVVANLIGGAPVAGPVAVEAEIVAPEWRLAELVVTGAVVLGDGADAVRTVRLSAWGAPVEVTAP